MGEFEEVCYRVALIIVAISAAIAALHGVFWSAFEIGLWVYPHYIPGAQAVTIGVLLTWAVFAFLGCGVAATIWRKARGN